MGLSIAVFRVVVDAIPCFASNIAKIECCSLDNPLLISVDY